MLLRCPSEPELLLLAVADDASPRGAMGRHVLECGSCQARVTQLRRQVDGIRAAASRHAPGDGGCLDELGVADFVTGQTSAGDRDLCIRHVAVCSKCRRHVAGLIKVLGDADVAGEMRRIERAPTPRRRLLGAAGLLAATAALLLVVRPQGTVGPSLTHRGPTLTATEAPTPITPLGDVATAARLEWSGVSGAERYRVSLFTVTGQVLLQTEITDTLVGLPDSLALEPGASYLWKVEARTGRDRWTTSELMEFRVTPSGKPGTSPIPPPDSLHVLARRLSDSALVREVLVRSYEVREALGVLLAQASRGGAGAREENLATAKRLASAYATAWNDGFLAREVARFTAWAPARAQAKVKADSLRRAGVAAFGQEGAEAAIAIWRRALSESVAVGDTAGMAATLGNIGAGLAREAQTDSATVYLQRSRTLAAAVGDVRVEANAVAELAGVSEQRNDPATAITHYRRSVELRKRIGDSRGLASDYNNLAGLARQAGDLDGARGHLEAALALNRRDSRAEVAATNLVNLASLASLAGDFTHADSLYREALSTWREREQWADVADAERGLGELGMRRGDYPAARAHLREALTLYDRTGPLSDAIAVREELAEVSAAVGDLQGALDELRETQRLADSAQLGPGVQAGVALARAELAAQLNRYPEAERLYASAGSLYRRAGNRSGEAEALKGWGILLVGRENLAGARRLLEQSLRAEIVAGDRRSAALTRLWLGEVALRSGDTTGARTQLARASTELEGLNDPVATAAALGAAADLEARSGLPAAAESLYRTALARVGARLVPEVTWRLHAGLGAIRREQGAEDAAARELRAAIRDIERAGRTIALPERRSGYHADKWDVYVQLALLEQRRGNVGAALDASERIRANEMREMLAQGRVPESPAVAADLVAREQDLRRYIADLTHGLERATAGAQTLRGPDISRGPAVTREGLLRAQEAYSDLLLEIRERAPRHAALVSREPSTWREAATRLASDQAFVEYLTSDEGSLAFVLTRDTVAAIRLGANRADLARLVDFARATLSPRGVPRLDSLWRAPLRQLHRDLVAPVETSGLLAGKRRLIIAPHAELHYLPFAALLDGESGDRFLVERFQVMVTPSASVWLALGSRPAGRKATGVLAMAPRPDALPASRGEVAATGAMGGTGTHVLVGSAATEQAFRRQAPDRRVIHLATYGVLNKQNPLFSFVELAPAGTDDGTLEVHEVFGLDLAADLVVLSACQTGLGSGALGDVPAGDDWIGLARAFLSAGAARVIATLWPVQDQATAALMERFYREYHLGGDPGRALAAAQRALLAAPATATPYYWGGFQLVGGR